LPFLSFPPPLPSGNLISEPTLTTDSFHIGYIYSFITAGLFYWGFNKFFPHADSIMDHPETGEDIIAAQDAKNVEKRNAERAERRPSVVARAFEV
jgi:NCS1 family nucleobase:cation symporter-1